MPRPKHPGILTEREQEVLEQLRLGLSNPEIAERLEITRETVKWHVSEILGKLGVGTREEAAAWQPEAEPSRWALAPLALRFGLMASAVALLGALGVLAWVVVDSGDADEGGESVTASSPTPTQAPTGSPPPTPAPSVPPLPDELIGFYRTEYTTDGQRVETWTINADGTGLSETGELGSRLALQESPNGEMIAWVDGVGGLGFVGDVKIANADGTGERTIAAVEHSDALPECVAGNSWLEWSPDSRYLAFTDDRTGLTVIDASTGEDVAHYPLAFAPAWSSDGRLAFTTTVRRTPPFPTGSVSGQDSCYIAMAASAGEPSTVLAKGLAPEWSYDGSLLAYSGQGGVYLYDLASDHESLLIGPDEMAEGGVDPSIPGWGGQPIAWSPTADEFVVGFSDQLVIVDASTGQWRVIPGAGYSAEWSDDGQWLVANDNQDSVVIVPANGSAPPVVLAQGSTPSWQR